MFAVALAQPTAVLVFHRSRQDGVQVTVEARAVATAGALGQVLAAFGDDESPQQQPLHARSKDGIASVDGVLAIAQPMGKTDLPGVGMGLLRSIEVGDP